MKLKYIIWTIIPLVILSVIVIIYANNKIETTTNNLVFNNVNEIPTNNTGLLLGTSKYLSNGKLNQYFENRITATVQLYKAGKIKNILISGDNSKQTYNEPQDMKDELVRKGIPAGNIYLDYAGLRTYDSVYRTNAIFGQTSFTIISQEFHNRRAIYIAKSLNLNASGFNAKDVNAYKGFKTKVREKLARVKVLIDLAIGIKPKFLGDKITIK